ncbi:MAG: 4Fe-4S binding protein [bacterium]|nr:MAG: 4Fe-4S binding protein [bacterium]
MCPEAFRTNPGGGGYRLLLGNEAIAQGLFEAGCRVAAAYPGTPSTEVLESLSRYRAPDLHVEWSVNEKIALEVASAASYAGLRSAAVMKQVGLNVALDPLMSLAYTGVEGGLIVVVADDPGPHSSQTEQDTRLLAHAAGVPLLDPMTPEEAWQMVHLAYHISEKYRVPVILRPVLRVCHARAPVPLPGERTAGGAPSFRREVNRWAATPGHRLTLHRELNEKLKLLGTDSRVLDTYRFLAGAGGKSQRAVLASGVPAAYAFDILRLMDADGAVPLLVAGVQNPFNPEHAARLLQGRDLLVLEETGPFMEARMRHLLRVSGRLDGALPSEGEMTPDTVSLALRSFLQPGTAVAVGRAVEVRTSTGAGETPSGSGGSAPVLCAGCPHRSSFWALKKAMPGAIFTGDIGCYTLGIDLGTVDTVLCMGASISQAAGFYWAFASDPGEKQDVAAVIGDSTFYHAGVPALINAVHQGAAFVLMILDNATTAMTGGQPTPGTGILAGGQKGGTIPLEEVIRGCGVRHLAVSDPCDHATLLSRVREAAAAARSGEMAVVISRSPCVLETGERLGPAPLVDGELCDACLLCVEQMGCPAIATEDGSVRILADLCPGCGLCVHVCPRGAILESGGEG